MTRHAASLLPELRVIDFNPHVNEELARRGINIVYGDISQRDTLLHAEISQAHIIVSTLTNTVLKGTSNLKLLRQLRELNPTAKIIVQAELLSDVPALYEAGAAYVCLPRLNEATDLLHLIQANRKHLLEERRAAQALTLRDRYEVIP
jgi:Trk K+ transport system NAD-binding subunit